MKTKKQISTNNKTLKNKLNQYISHHKDICCEKDVDKKQIIDQLFELYEKIAEYNYEKDNYLDYINNDIVGLIGIKIDLMDSKDKEGVKLWDELDRRCYKNNEEYKKKGKLDKLNIIKLLNELPLYLLLSFLGLAYSKYKPMEDYLKKNKVN